MKRTILRLSTASVLLAIASACSTSRGSAPEAPGMPAPPAAVTPFEGTHWTLIELRGTAARPARDARPPHAVFQADVASVRGHGGVNSFFGPYVQDGASLRIERLASTRMAGPTELMEQESALLDVLQSARTWEVSADVLQLFDVRGALLARFQASESPETSPAMR